MDRLVDAVARRGGKLHLAKDQVLTPEQFRRLYPGHERLLALKARLDPDGLFATDLARRVGLCGAPRDGPIEPLVPAPERRGRRRRAGSARAESLGSDGRITLIHRHNAAPRRRGRCDRNQESE